jgi:hypothetical protein
LTVVVSSDDDDIRCFLTLTSGCKTVEVDVDDDEDVDAAVVVPPEEKKDDIDLCLLCGCALRVDASFINSNLLLPFKIISSFSNNDTAI